MQLQIPTHNRASSCNRMYTSSYSTLCTLGQFENSPQHGPIMHIFLFYFQYVTWSSVLAVPWKVLDIFQFFFYLHYKHDKMLEKFHIFQYIICLKVLTISGQNVWDNGLWPGQNKNTARSTHPSTLRFSHGCFTTCMLKWTLTVLSDLVLLDGYM